MKNTFILLAIILQITACKKNNSGGGGTNNPPSSCRITKIDVTPYTPDYFLLKYDNNGKLIGVDDGPGGNYKREIAYQDHAYTLMEYNGPSLIRSIKGDLDNDDRLLQVTEKQYEAGILRHTVVRTFAYYTGGDLKRQQVDIDGDINYMWIDYDWLNGNLQHEMLNGKPGPPSVPTIHTYDDYDTQHTLPAGTNYDLTRFYEVLAYGRILIKNKNPLIKQTLSQQNANDIIVDYENTFDIKGNISLIKGTRPNTSNGPYTIAYTYECN